jgi:hypothetical protein
MEMGQNALESIESQPMFRKESFSCSFSHVKFHIGLLFNFEEECDILLWKADWLLMDHTTLDLGRYSSSS